MNTKDLEDLIRLDERCDDVDDSGGGRVTPETHSRVRRARADRTNLCHEKVKFGTTAPSRDRVTVALLLNSFDACTVLFTFSTVNSKRPSQIVVSNKGAYIKSRHRINTSHTNYFELLTDTTPTVHQNHASEFVQQKAG